MAERETSHTPFQDVRLHGFARRKTVAEAWQWIDSVTQPLPSEWVEAASASGRVLAEPITSPVDVPMFARAMMDGYAVQARDTGGASAYQSVRLRVIGQVLPGQTPSVSVTPGTAVRIMTGAPLPPGADAVVPFEQTEGEADTVAVVGEVVPGKNVGRPGEDVAQGSLVFQPGRRLRPQDLGVLASIGVARVPVIRRPVVRILVTGDELLPAGQQPEGYRIVDANGPMLRALATRDGAVVASMELIPDQPQAILDALRQPADVVLISGGSSVGQEDHAPSLLARHGELAVHGVAMRPSSPAGMGRFQERLVFLLPGNPVSCLCAYDFFAGRAIRRLGGRSADWPYPCRRLPLARKLVSLAGRVDYARVQIRNGQVEPIAVSGASILSSTTRADGFVIVPQDSEGYPPGAEVDVYLYDTG
ncbi:MAG: molybdopterin molybdenumtransferase MoeA [Pirellulaceae bacterium]|nr:MAG: molybdopterin molybdenumtransferase MoeA [Pirellulaceae bacterium]